MKDNRFLQQPPLLAELAKLDGAGLERFYARFLERIAELEPTLRVFEDGSFNAAQTKEECARVVKRWPDPGKRPPLFGLPVGVKAIVRVAGRRIRCGSMLPADLFEGEEASLVTRLREAGAIVVGQTTSTEFAYYEPGPTCNPHNVNHTPGGSSSGSPAGVAAGFFSLGIGSQTVGSTIRPASFCGVTGFKPSFGRLPVDGFIPFAPSADHPGFFAVNPSELASVMAILDPKWRKSALPGKLRLALPTGPYLNDALPQTLSWLRAQAKVAAARLEKKGCRVDFVEIPCLEDIEGIRNRHNLFVAFETAPIHEKWFNRFGMLYRPRTAQLVLEGRAVKAEEAEAALASRLELRQRLHELLKKHEADFWYCPATVGEAPLITSGTGTPIMNSVWTHAGTPALTLPMGTGEQGLPLGMQLVGDFGKDEELLTAGTAMLAD